MKTQVQRLFLLNKETVSRRWKNPKFGEMGRKGTRKNFNYFPDILLTTCVEENTLKCAGKILIIIIIIDGFQTVYILMCVFGIVLL